MIMSNTLIKFTAQWFELGKNIIIYPIEIWASMSSTFNSLFSFFLFIAVSIFNLLFFKSGKFLLFFHLFPVVMLHCRAKLKDRQWIDVRLQQLYWQL